MAQGVWRCRFGDASLLYSALERSLEGLVVQVMSAHDPAARIGRVMVLREHPEPGPGGAHARVLSIQGVRHLGPQAVVNQPQPLSQLVKHAHRAKRRQGRRRGPEVSPDWRTERVIGIMTTSAAPNRLGENL